MSKRGKVTKFKKVTKSHLLKKSNNKMQKMRNEIQ